MDLVETAGLIVLFLHFVGLAAIVGPFILQLGKRENLQLRTMLIGAILQIVTGALLVALRSAGDQDTDYAKIAAKLGIAVLVLGAMIIATVAIRRSDSGSYVPTAVGLFRVAGVLAVTDIAVAVFWR